MAAIATCQPPRALGSLRLSSVRPSDRRPPSAAVRQRRAASTLVVLAALGILLGAGSLAGAEQAPTGPPSRAGVSAATPVASAAYVVQPGDTLWTLGRRVQPQGDVRPLVARLLAVHGPGPLVPGERLSIAV
jgi:nucleoid-associated protein YgaU